MTLAVYPDKIDAFLNLAAKMGVEATVLGRFTDSGMFHVCYGEQTVAFLDMEFLHEGLPQMKLNARWTPLVFRSPIFPIRPIWTRSERDAGTTEHLQQGIRCPAV